MLLQTEVDYETGGERSEGRKTGGAALRFPSYCFWKCCDSCHVKQVSTFNSFSTFVLLLAGFVRIRCFTPTLILQMHGRHAHCIFFAHPFVTHNIYVTADLILTQHAAIMYLTNASDILDLPVIGADEFCFI